MRSFFFISMVLFLAATAFGQKVEKRIVVVLSSQTVYAFEGDKVVMELRCSTGRKGYGTPATGGKPVKIAAKIASGRALPEFGGGTLPYQMRMHIAGRRISFHAYKSVPTYPASHGCVRLRQADAKKLFSWASVGTPVWIHQKVPSC
jgi:lipoprotein-anchoring transpeptidase ErfK/SrfK